MSVAILVENLSKQYRLGSINRGTLTQDLQSWWARMRGKEDPNLRIDETIKGGNGQEDKVWALRDVSFGVNEGEVLGIIGANGAGKSTVLKIISQVTAPTRGEVKIRGRVASLLEIGTGFHSELTGRENIFLNGAILGMTKAEIRQKFDDIVGFSGVEKYIDTPVKRYSSGMSVRLGFAVAAHLDPEILVVDEVLAVGDAEFQRKCLRKMGELGKQARTILFVSHRMASINTLCDRCVVLNKGSVAFDGSTGEGIRNYLEMASDGLDKESASRVVFSPREGMSAQFLEARITDVQGNTAQTVRYQDGFQICLKTVVHRKEKNLYTWLMIENQIGEVVTVVTDKDMGPPVLGSLDQGTYELCAPFPGKLLQPGLYYVSISIGIKPPGLDVDSYKQVLTLEIEDNESWRARTGTYPTSAAVAPEIPWKVA